jgi:hypothetical protein
MKKRNLARTQHGKNATKAIDTKYLLLTAVCGLVLVASFFFAARQHFSSIDYSMQNNKLKKQVEDLESDKQRLLLAREVSLSPGEIRKAAKKIGLLDVVTAGTAKPLATIAETAKFAKPASNPANDRKLVQKTTLTAPVIAAERQKIAEKQEKLDPLARERKVQIAKR